MLTPPPSVQKVQSGPAQDCHEERRKDTVLDETRRTHLPFSQHLDFSEYTVVDSACVVKIDRSAPLKTMTLLSCGVSTGLGAAWNTANVQAGSTVAVFGLGAVGLAVVEGARSGGASRIIGIDINFAKLTKGEAMGVTDIINPLELKKPVHEVSI
ncbi:hypothetical protein L1887_06662 [Cichorium endivia]|nr:hypothetical protein L1887_06662 [Cichorium endivia]